MRNTRRTAILIDINDGRKDETAGIPFYRSRGPRYAMGCGTKLLNAWDRLICTFEMSEAWFWRRQAMITADQLLMPLTHVREPSIEAQVGSRKSLQWLSLGQAKIDSLQEGAGTAAETTTSSYQAGGYLLATVSWNEQEISRLYDFGELHAGKFSINHSKCGGGRLSER